MKREIYEVTAKVVDAANAYTNLTGYPASFDSHQNYDDLDRTLAKAKASYYKACEAGETARANGRPLTVVSLLRMSDGLTLMAESIGKMPELPNPKYTVTVTNGTGSGQYEEGAIVNIEADTPEEGMVFASWDGAEELTFVEGNMNVSSSSFLMPTEAVNLTATYMEIPPVNEEEN